MGTLAAPIKKKPSNDSSFENKKVIEIHEPKPKDKGEGVKLVGSPQELINLMITDVTKKKSATDQIINEGPKHKQVLSALLLKRLNKLVQTIEHSSNTKFTLQKGSELTLEKENKKTILPIAFPLNIDSGLDEKKVVEAISYAPEHEALVYAMSIQVIEWAIKAASKK